MRKNPRSKNLENNQSKSRVKNLEKTEKKLKNIRMIESLRGKMKKNYASQRVKI